MSGEFYTGAESGRIFCSGIYMTLNSYKFYCENYFKMINCKKVHEKERRLRYDKSDIVGSP